MSGEKNKPYLTVKDHLVSGESFQLIWNSELDLLRTDPIPEIGALPKYYDSEAYISHTDSRNGIIEFLYQKVKAYALGRKARLMESQNRGVGKLLDVGAGTGAFLEKAVSKGWHVCGVEPNEGARNIAGDRGIELYAALEEIKEEQYDVITLWHVLEHMPDLQQAVQDLTRLLAPGGILIIAVPNFRSYDAKYYKEFWAAYDVPRHIWHFSKSSLSRIFSKDFEFVKIKPMLFDSFYVSLLSEKYNSGKTFSIRAIWIGFLSNLKGFFSKEYSSHIYIFKRQE